MEIEEVIKSRRSVRRYNDNLLDKNDIDYLLDLARLAPSGKNKQPWRYLILNRKEKTQVVKFMNDYSLNHNDDSVRMTASVIDKAQALILVFGDISKNNEVEYINDILSIGSSITNILLGATNRNISSLWVGNILKVKEEVEKYVKVGKPLISSIVLGYSDEIIKSRPRLSLEEIVINK